jgi:hypothetical protein
MNRKILVLLCTGLFSLSSVGAESKTEELKQALPTSVEGNGLAKSNNVSKDNVPQNKVSENNVSQNKVPEKPVALSVAELKKKVIKLNRDLFILEEDLLFPANTQFVVYLSLDTGKFFKPDSVILKVNDEVVAAHLYTTRQMKALSRGGMQRLHMGNLKSGAHEITAIVQGLGTDGREYKRAASLAFEKGSDISSLEIKISDQSSNYQPNVEIIEWN